MTVVLVTHRTELPAVDGMIAGMIAAERDAPVVALVTGGAGLGRHDSTQHVLAHGELVGNGLFWGEWASGRLVGPSMQAAAVPLHPSSVVVVPINPAIAAQATAAARIVHHAERIGRTVERLEVVERDGIFEVHREGADEADSRWTRDGFGRPRLADAGPVEPGRSVRLLVVGDEDLLRDTYPANLAALGDAADALGIGVSFAFWDPRDGGDGMLDGILGSVDGVVLPGGSDMEQVAGQIEIAQFTLRSDLPTVGLCLGMQTMATAVAREVVGYNDANMEEADPSAQTKTFVRLHDEHGRPEFRLGLRRPRIAAGSRLSDILGGATRFEVHCNHRYVLDPQLHAALDRAGLRLSGLQDERDLADAIELPSLRFFVGMQGHPELMTRRGRPHPLILAFLREVAHP